MTTTHDIKPTIELCRKGQHLEILPPVAGLYELDLLRTIECVGKATQAKGF